MILVVLLFGLIPLFVTSFTGGLAGAIVARGRENRTIWANGGIGLVGWSFAWIAWAVLGGSWPEEISFGLGLVALLASIAFVYILERRATRPSVVSEDLPTI